MALRNQPYLALYVQDWLCDANLRYCSASAKGVYIDLMCVMHQSEPYGTFTLRKQFTGNGEGLHPFACQLRTQLSYDTEEIETALNELIENGVLTHEGDVIYQKRMVRDGELSMKRANAGAKGGRESGKNQDEESDDKQTPKQNGNKMPSKNEAKVEAKSEQNTEIENEYENESEYEIEKYGEILVDVNIPESDTKPTDSKEINLLEERFNTFWQTYPKKSGKGYARKCFMKISPNKELFGKIIDAVERAKQTKQWRRDGGQFIPNPATWLNQERWEDDYTDTGQSGGRMLVVDPNINPFEGWDSG